MKTPVEELIEKLELNPVLNANVLHLINSMDLLKKEHDEIISSYKIGWANGADFKADPEHYFLKKYKS
jgi:hypothetical protein